jgi:hypothetical protein
MLNCFARNAHRPHPLNSLHEQVGDCGDTQIELLLILPAGFRLCARHGKKSKKGYQLDDGLL